MDRRNFLKTYRHVHCRRDHRPLGFSQCRRRRATPGRLVLPMNRNWRFSRYRGGRRARPRF